MRNFEVQVDFEVDTFDDRTASRLGSRLEADGGQRGGRLVDFEVDLFDTVRRPKGWSMDRWNEAEPKGKERGGWQVDGCSCFAMNSSRLETGEDVAGGHFSSADLLSCCSASL